MGLPASDGLKVIWCEFLVAARAVKSERHYGGARRGLLPVAGVVTLLEVQGSETDLRAAGGSVRTFSRLLSGLLGALSGAHLLRSQHLGCSGVIPVRLCPVSAADGTRRWGRR
jgi:hypothetical protein